MFARVIASIIAAIVLAAPMHVTAQAQNDESRFGFALVPSENPDVTAKGYFIYQMRSGSSTVGQVQLSNMGTQPITVKLAAVDAVTAQTGGSAFATEASPDGVAQWIDLEESLVTLQPNTEQKVEFSVHAPDSVQPGQYLAGIAASVQETASTSAQTEASKQTGASIHLQKRYVIAVQSDVAGIWTPRLSIDGVDVLEQPTGTYIGVQMRNDGTAFIKPSGSLVLTNSAGEQILSHPIEMGTFVTGTEVTYPIVWPESPKAGKYQVAVNLAYGEGQTATYTNEIEISAQEEARSADVQARALPGASQAPAQVSAIQPWMVYSVGALLLLVVILLALNLKRMSGSRQTV